ncbi:haloacid dehalogenase type II [Pseudarthrobacter niigatensis]|uniref:2-haloacid dehalogenase n=1 Tax=Pseudarthrobacter niigatensis TaxID=369935 RepID=A0AAJ1SVF2_9MICC|nr:haloacid dehalogenase type II [Pseudarthrobacter niigatensis]MDQ0147776.1 2-haloacid dehalogenase [Pseudarthrobacter niigatensis]MDQ0267742.1 2-haloacid dehalogenase [Pseudarthrobacter niigatensis]
MKPSVIVFDVNETLSDMSPMARRFVDVGAPAHMAQLWFATLLRDGFALTAAGDNSAFAGIGAEVLHGLFTGMELNRNVESAVQHIMAGFAGLGLHPDVVGGVKALHSAGHRLVTLTNGSTQVAEKLFTDAGIRDNFDKLLSVEDAPLWKPGKSSYDYAATICGTSPGQMLLVAVHPWDIHGASRAGLATAWINRSGTPYPNYFQAPNHVLAALPDLAPALAGGK